MRRLGVWLIVWAAWAAVAPGPVNARDIILDVERGDDENPGTSLLPVATTDRAVELAEPDDTIHLGPEGALIRQELVLSGKERITIDGHGCTLTGADHLPQDDWEQLGPNLARRRMPQTNMQRYLLIVGGKANRMGRSPSVYKEFPPPEQLQPGQFCWQDIRHSTPADDPRAVQHVARWGWLYVCGPRDGLEWSVRLCGVRATGENRDVTIRNLNCRHVLNAAFNIHGDCRGLRCVDVTGYECFDEGFSAHDTCQCSVERSCFWGNDNAVSDVNQSETSYCDCEFRDSLSSEVVFFGGQHTLDDCLIVAAGRNALFASSTSVGHEEKQYVPIQCQLTGCILRSVDDTPHGVTVHDADLTLDECRLERIQFSATESRVTVSKTTLDGQPLNLQ